MDQPGDTPPTDAQTGGEPAGETQLKLAIDLFGLVIWRHDLHSNRIYFNENAGAGIGMAYRAEGYAVEEVRDITHPDDVGRIHAAVAEALAGDAPVDTEARFRHVDGSWRHMLVRRIAQRNAAGEAVALLGVSLDVTERRAAQLALQKANESRAKSDLLARMSHELRTPLNAVLGFTQLLEIEAQQSGAQARLARLAQVRHAGEHLLTLINATLDLSDLAAGAGRFDLRAVALAPAVHQALGRVAADAVTQGVAVGAGDLDGVVCADPERLQQVLQSLLGNAIKYSGRGDTVRIATQRDGACVRIRVSDSGRGMGPEQLQHLFEPFNRLGVDAAGIAGTGLALTIVKALVTGMHGRIDVSSAPGQGSEFVVELPAAAQPAAAATAPAAATAAELRDGRLLYIEDNRINVLLVEQLVERVAGLRMVAEASGLAGVARAREWRPDLILIDLQLPDIDGFEVLRRLRAEPESAATPCIALSANAQPEDVARARALGFDEYWTKPIDVRRFLGALEGRFARG